MKTSREEGGQGKAHNTMEQFPLSLSFSLSGSFEIMQNVEGDQMATERAVRPRALTTAHSARDGEGRYFGS